MIEEIKGLKARRDKAQAKINDLEAKKDTRRMKLAEAEDTDKPTAKPQAAYQQIKTDLETTMATFEKIDGDLKSKNADLLDLQLKNYPKDKQNLESERAEIFQRAGQAIGEATLALRTIGPDGADVGSGILKVLQKYSDICAPVIEARAAVVNAAVALKFSGRKNLHARLEDITKNPLNKSRYVERYYHCALKDDFDFLIGL